MYRLTDPARRGRIRGRRRGVGDGGGGSVVPRLGRGVVEAAARPSATPVGGLRSRRIRRQGGEGGRNELRSCRSGRPLDLLSLEHRERQKCVSSLWERPSSSEKSKTRERAMRRLASLRSDRVASGKLDPQAGDGVRRSRRSDRRAAADDVGPTRPARSLTATTTTDRPTDRPT